MRKHALRLTCALLVAWTLAFAPSAFAQGGTVTTFSGAATAVDINSGFGPCTVAVAGSIDGSSIGGSGAFTATDDPPAYSGTSACLGGPASLRFRVTGGTATAGGDVHLDVTVQSSDAADAGPGTAGTIDLSRSGQSLSIQIGAHQGAFSNQLWSGFLDLRTDVDVATYADATGVTYFGGTGTADDIYQGYGSCGVAVAGTQVLGGPVAGTIAGGGSFQAVGGVNGFSTTSTCAGGEGRLSYDLATLTTDGQNLSTAGVVVGSSTDAATPGGTAGTITVDEPNQLVSAVIGGHAGNFGPDHSVFAGFIDLRGAGVVDTRPVDTDGDGIPDVTDNCRTLANADQANLDGDGEGDACDADDDNDGVADAADNCPAAANADQANTDRDTQGNACDADDDNDGVADATDNCVTTPNADQRDTDGDRVGDECDPTPGSTPGTAAGLGTIARGAFALAVESKRAGDTPRGLVTYNDPVARLVFVGGEFTSLVVVRNQATIRGRGWANGKLVQFRIDLLDAGEFGRNDTFMIQLSNGYTAGGKLVVGNLRVS